MISVVIPAYNSEKTIIECINGVLNQTRVDLIEEILVIDDGSKDETVSKIKENINCGFLQVISKPNGGVSTARNLGILKAKAEWIALLDSDDIWKPDKTEKQVGAIDAFPEIRFIGANRNSENVKMGKRVSGSIRKLSLRNILFKNWPHTSTVMIHKSVFKKVGLFDETMKYAEDGNLWNRIAIEYPLYYIAESLETAGGGKRQYGESGLSSNLKGMYDGNIKNLRELKESANIGLVEYEIWRLWFWIKHIKRKTVTRIVSRSSPDR